MISVVSCDITPVVFARKVVSGKLLYIVGDVVVLDAVLYQLLGLGACDIETSFAVDRGETLVSSVCTFVMEVARLDCDLSLFVACALCVEVMLAVVIRSVELT